MIREIEKKVERYIQKKQLIQKGDTVVVGVSGGADSMMLIDYLYTHQESYDIKLKVAHVHHGIREEASRDKNYVEAWCRERNIPCYIHHCNIKTIAKEKKISEEEAGRIERYNFFISLTNEYGKIAIAHHTNDQAETMIMHFLRGSDIKGLGGIQPKRDNIIRPILCLSRQEIEAYCHKKKLTYYDDHTNFMTVYTRNKVRLKCIPYIEEEINPNIQETLFRQGELYQEAASFIEDYAEKLFKRCVTHEEDSVKIHIPTLQEEMAYMQKKLLYNALGFVAKGHKDLSQVHVQSCLELIGLQSGKEIHLPYQIIAKREYDYIILKKQEVDIFTNYEYSLKMGINKISHLNLQVELKFCSRKTFEQCKENMYTKYVDYDKIKDNLQLRTRKPGDFITLKSGKKKLKKLLIDDKVPQDKRNTLPLLADQEEVIWIIGSRVNSKYFIVPKTEKILEIKITK